VLIVDDEAPARRRLARMLARLDEVEIVGEAADGDEALERIRETAPDVVLLDIRMPGRDGLEVATSLGGDGPHVIFTTAYEEYAVRAFEASAVDYLVKPVEPARLESALEKARRLGERQDPAALSRLLERLAGRSDPPRISARHGDAVHVFDAREIPRFHAEGGYSAFRHEGREYLIEDSIVSLERRLEAWGFLRVHRGELVNLEHVRALKREDERSYLELDDGQRAWVSRRHLGELKRRLGLPGG
jgi:DNA-binding LytR/AlgR family response regulator